jgi:hypothetical protein
MESAVLQRDPHYYREPEADLATLKLVDLPSSVVCRQYSKRDRT